MPSIIIGKDVQASTSGTKGTKTFTGDVLVDPVYNTANTKINNVCFSPGARSYWHTHEHGQLLKVLAGSGWICDRGGLPRRLVAGDIVWAEAGTTHWHGGNDENYMCHLAVSHGATVWHEEVATEDLPQPGSAS